MSPNPIASHPLTGLLIYLPIQRTFGRVLILPIRLKGFVRLAQIVVWIFGGVLIVSAVLDRSPVLLLTGFGAMTPILALVASMQLTAQDMVRVGDWIEMPQFGADGDVVDVQLHTVKVQNWDKTTTTIPTHRLVAESFTNWRGADSLFKAGENRKNPP